MSAKPFVSDIKAIQKRAREQIQKGAVTGGYLANRKQVVEILNEALATGEGAAIADSVLQKLVDYALTHFAAEEALMTEYEFPGLSTHCMEHQKFAESVTKLLKDYRVGKAGVPVSLLLFLQTWLKRHILVADKAYSSFLNARGVH